MNSTVKLSFAGVLILIVILRLVGCSGEGPVPDIAFRHYRVVTEASARMASEHAPEGDGPIVAVIGESESAHLTKRSDWFRKAAEELELSKVEIVVVSKGDWSEEKGWSPALLRNISTSYPDARAVVSFVGPPPSGSSGEFSPWTLVVLPNPIPMDAARQHGSVDATIEPSTVPADRPPLPKKASDDDFFNRYYQLSHEPRTQ